ncbi:MAG: type II toxin-antitoxin system death-on-curing family toxin [Rhodanobacter sp.]|nr:MAG: type II toxin-antitoxin system death-on-curing family toxin [Rhodanobacter sp.]TAM13361.1 MAG: type II toxin-antitoxin system death-on-curing family toxin [Rhodanobacter sp.]TAM35080.1 MAG: type II toxin-antitoxin system death-on-curing family toxin [Rhodanobacter sp.]
MHAIVWIDRELALAIHDRQLAEHGGADGVRDEGLLASALARPQQLQAYAEPEPDLADLAAALAHGLARNHPSVDGNKRTAYVVCRTFMALNGGQLAATVEDKYQTFLALVDGSLSVDAFAAWLRDHLRPQRVQEAAASYRR